MKCTYLGDIFEALFQVRLYSIRIFCLRENLKQLIIRQEVKSTQQSLALKRN